MNKNVYLFELDSVRKTDDEIKAGQEALLNEIIVHGNNVVVTFNQLVESRGFFSLFMDESYREHLIALFEAGAIRVSQYGDIRTAAQYLINAIDNKDARFLYSALPVKESQKRLLALLRRSLVNSDLSEITEYLEGKRSKEELKDLFIEVQRAETAPSSLEDAMKLEILSSLYWMVYAVLKISMIKGIYLPPRAVEEYAGYKLSNYLEAVLRFQYRDIPGWEEAKDVLHQLKCYGKNGRSDYVRELEAASTQAEGSVFSFRLAEAIVDLCYNYACEMSICNISKHYDIKELAEPDNEMSTFRMDFQLRLLEYWNNGKDRGHKFLQEETNEYKPYSADSSLNRLMETAVGLRQNQRTETEKKETEIPRYEWKLKEQRAKQRYIAARAFAKKIGKLLLAVLVLFILTIVFQVIQCIFDADLSFMESLPSIARFVGETIAFLIVGELVTTFLSNRIKWFIPLSDALTGLIHTLGNILRLIFRRKYKPHENSEKEKIEIKESRSIDVPISYVDTVAMKRYRKLRKEREELFKENELYPIEDPETMEARRKITRENELFDTSYGVSYQSKYHMMVVDPIQEGDRIYPYERIIQTLPKHGVVIVTVYKGEFILLRQFRHAPRAESLCFPRGFAEPDAKNYIENVRRELEEELKGVIKGEPRYLGSVASDSGLSNDVADVVYVEMKSYEPNVNHEGIKTAEGVSEKKLEKMIRSGMITDGFTLSAYAIYSADRQKSIHA